MGRQAEAHGRYAGGARKRANVETLRPRHADHELAVTRRVDGQRLLREWRGTEQTMRDQTDQTNPTQQYDQPEHTDEQQPIPG